MFDSTATFDRDVRSARPMPLPALFLPEWAAREARGWFFEPSNRRPQSQPDM